MLAVLVLLSGCSSSEPEAAASGSANGEVIEASGLVETARERGASEEQIAVLQGGDVSYADYDAAVGRTLACMRDAGIEVVGGQVSEARGFPEIPYSFAGSSAGRTDEQTLALADQCINTHSFFIEGAYQMSPAALEAQDARFEPYRAAIVECIRSNGGEVEDGAGREQVVLAATTVQGVDCLAKAGFQP
jgi:hypothetical protein